MVDSERWIVNCKCLFLGWEGSRRLVTRQLTRKLGNVSPDLLARIEALSLERVELLSEDLLDFTSIANLEQWLA